jgi:hypothetical protein
MKETEAFNKFENENPSTFDGSILANNDQGQYLHNRLSRAFHAGCSAGKEIERERIGKVLLELIG